MPPIRILSYHSIGDLDTPLTIKEKDFERHVAILSSTFSPVHLREIVDYVTGRGRLPEDAVAITFDDGYRDNLTLALPILLKYQVPATIFVATGFVGSCIPLYTEMLPALSWTEIQEMNQSGVVEFGAHTRTHVRLSDVPAWVAKRAISDSKSDLEEHLGRPVQMFSYPQGRFNSAVIRILQEAGFRGACGGAGMVHRLSSPYRLRRLQIEGGTSGNDLNGVLAKVGNWPVRLPLDAVRRAMDMRTREATP